MLYQLASHDEELCLETTLHTPGRAIVYGSDLRAVSPLQSFINLHMQNHTLHVKLDIRSVQKFVEIPGESLMATLRTCADRSAEYYI